MATVAHTIYSRHDSQRPTIEEEVTLDSNGTPETDPWLTERATFGLSARAARPPKFVRAEVEYDPWLSQSTAGPSRASEQELEKESDKESVSSWYKSLVRSREPKEEGKQRASVETKASIPSSGVQELDPTSPKRMTPSISAAGGNSAPSPWFISRALSSQASSSSSSSKPAPTLADILSLNPPSLNPSQKLVPPIFLSIGPGNKGFEMLAKSGWEEGEGLGGLCLQCGADRVNNARGKAKAIDPSSLSWTQDAKLKVETIEVLSPIPSSSRHDNEEEEVQEIRKVDVVDLISDVEDSNDDGEDDLGNEGSTDNHDYALSSLDHNPVSLLTPLPTVLKSDRLGIGLKRKRQKLSSHSSSSFRGPRELTKRVTHTPTAIAAHSQGNEQLRKQARMRDGRGRKGFQKAYKREAEKRQAVLQYLNG